MARNIEYNCDNLDGIYYAVIRIDASKDSFTYKTAVTNAEYFESDASNAEHVAVLRDDKTVSIDLEGNKKYI